MPAVRRTIKGRKIRRVYSREAAGELVDPPNASYTATRLQHGHMATWSGRAAGGTAAGTPGCSRRCPWTEGRVVGSHLGVEVQDKWRRACEHRVLRGRHAEHIQQTPAEPGIQPVRLFNCQSVGGLFWPPSEGLGVGSVLAGPRDQQVILPIWHKLPTNPPHPCGTCSPCYSLGERCRGGDESVVTCRAGHPVHVPTVLFYRRQQPRTDS